MFDDAGSARMLEAFASINAPGYLDSPGGMAAARAEIHERLHWFRERYVPWLASIRSLQGCRVLEIGSGGGSSTVALAEAGAIVDALDLDAGGQTLAVPRAELCGVRSSITFHVGNATEIAERFDPGEHEIICYLASLEHMTFQERVRSLRSAWRMLRPGGLLVIADTPNRLWHLDDHTTFETFFHWLPDEVAIAYASRTSRPAFAADMELPDPGLRLARWGRGVSYHDITIAIEDDADKYYVSGEWEFRRERNPDYAKWWAGTTDGRFHAMLCELAPSLPAGFLESELAICLRR